MGKIDTFEMKKFLKNENNLKFDKSSRNWEKVMNNKIKNARRIRKSNEKERK